jgi:hypothetical protein
VIQYVENVKKLIQHVKSENHDRSAKEESIQKYYHGKQYAIQHNALHAMSSSVNEISMC